MKNEILYKSIEEWLDVLVTFNSLDNVEYKKRNNLDNPIYKDFLHIKKFVEDELDRNTNKIFIDIINKYEISKFVDFWGTHFNMLKLAIEMNYQLNVMYEYNFPYNDSAKLKNKLIEIEKIAKRENKVIGIIPLNVKDYLSFFKLKCCEVFLNNSFIFNGMEKRKKNKFKNDLIEDFILAIVSDNYINDKKFNSNIRITVYNLKTYERIVNEIRGRNNLEKYSYKKISPHEIEYVVEKSNRKNKFYVH